MLANTCARYLLSLPLDDAASELAAWSACSALDALAALDVRTAASLMALLPEAQRAELLGLMPPHLAANIVQAWSCCFLQSVVICLQPV
jgi:Mg/Co/Ni transporter MgtE